MNIRDLKYLVALAEYGHFGKAAEACFVSQPGLSMQIKKLEEAFGIQLLERNHKSVLLTDNGKKMVEYAQKILNHVDEMYEIAKSTKDPFSGELKIGIISTVAPYLLPRIIPGLSKTFPKLSFYLIEEQTAVLVEKLKHGKIDTALMALPIPETHFAVLPLFEEEFLLATPHTHSLAKRKVIKQNDLHDKNLLLLQEGHCLREQALTLCHRMKTSEVQNFQASSLETLRHMVASGIGITLIPKLARQTHDGIAYIPFASPKPSRIIGLFSRSSSAKQNTLKEIAVQIRKILEKQNLVEVIHK